MGKWQWGVILDAGSSGTRIHIYKWLDSTRAQLEATPKELQSLPKLVTKKSWTKKSHPGISTFGDNPSAVGDKHLKDLLEHALSIVPKKQVADTPIFLMATAGVRLLSESQRTMLLSEICRYTRATNTFTLPSCDLHVQAIQGETEGLYGWIATNYLLGGFDDPESHAHGKDHHTYGFLDMGGASAQIAFAPNQTEANIHANDLKLLRMRKLNGESTNYKVFVASWLRFGVHEARVRYIEALEESIAPASGIRELPDPCLPAGLTLTIDGQVIDPVSAAAGSEKFLKGLGRFDECLRKTYPLLDKDGPCEDEPCLLHGQHVPAIDFDVNHFVGVSEYWHTTYEIFEMSYKDKTYDFNAYRSRVDRFCSQDWVDIEKGVKSLEWGKKVNERTAIELCFKASWLISMLHEGIGIPRVRLEKPSGGYNGTNDMLQNAKEKGFLDPFRAVNKIDDTEVSWTLGKMVLYAAGQIKPREGALPVGFGSNIPSDIPDDFQYAGSSFNEHAGDSGDNEIGEDAPQIAGNILENVQKNSTVSIFLLILLLSLLAYFFRKRERRKKVYNKFGILFRRNRRPGSPRKTGRSFFAVNKLFGWNSGRDFGQYERVLENGETANDFELHEIDSDENEQSDSSERSRLARSTGMSTPKPSVSFNDLHYFENTPTHSVGPLPVGNGLGFPNAMDRSGLVVRTESRERLAPSMQMLGAGRRSRAGSPTRGKSPMMTPLEEV